MSGSILHRRSFFLFICLIPLLAIGQDTEDLVELHKRNLKDLYETRGAPPEWVTTGAVDDNYLLWAIRHYEKKTAILIYTYQDGQLFLDLIDQDSVKLQSKISIQQAELTALIQDANLFLSRGSGDNVPLMRGSKVRMNRKSNRKLSKAFDQVNAYLLPATFGMDKYEHLVIVPVLNISTLPFSAFRIGDDYLIDKMSYSIAPSLFEIMVSTKVNSNDYRSKKKTYSWNKALFVANPEYPQDSIWSFPELPGTIREVEAIAALIPDSTYNILSGSDATKIEVMKRMCSSDLLYFATHGISNSENPMDHSFLVLSESEDESGFLTLKEIMNTRETCMLEADLVVLSACQTGLGRSHEGGIIGLARSFQIAGANHVLMSLWSIDDEQTAHLMSSFFSELLQERDLMPHEALRQAILKYKTSVNGDPKYWAAFSIFGVPY